MSTTILSVMISVTEHSKLQNLSLDNLGTVLLQK